MKAAISRILSFAAKNERHLGAIAFVLGFCVDLYVFTVLSVAYANLAFAGYLCLALCVTALSTGFPRASEYQASWRRVVSIVTPLVAQYAIGSLLSGFMIFYTKSSAISASWPFLLLLALVFFGNEFFRTHYKYLAFQLSLLYFALYAYLIFAIPLALGKLGFWVFLASTISSMALFAVYAYILFRINSSELRSSLRYALPGTLLTILLICTAYGTGVLPPIPLTMTEKGIYHSLKKGEGTYVVQAEAANPWYAFYAPRIIHETGTGKVLVAYASVAAPIKFGAHVVHRWERLDSASGDWVTESRIQFAISGGRPGGFRGYSEFAPRTVGKWRVSVETPEGQVIGRIPFTLQISSAEPVLHEETH